MNALTHICPRLSDRIQFKDDFVNESIYNQIQEMSPKFSDLLVNCKSVEFPGECSVMKPVFHDEGLCFTFNALNSHEIYTES